MDSASCPQGFDTSTGESFQNDITDDNEEMEGV